MQRISVLPFSILLLLSTLSLHAAKFETLGYRSVSMGGAAVANSPGSIAAYNNPALLGKTPYTVEVSVGGGASGYDHGIGASIVKLNDIGYLDVIEKASQDLTSLTEQDVETLIEGSDIVLHMNGNAMVISPQAYTAVQINGFGFGVFGNSDSAATAVVDEVHNQLIFYDAGSNEYIKINDDGTPVASDITEYTNSSIEYAINNGLTYLDVTGVSVAEVPIAYGHSLETAIGNIMIGGAFKYMEAITYTEKLVIDYSGNLVGDAGEKVDQTSSNFGLDLGLAYQPAFAYDLTFGLVAKNLNSPEFDFHDGSKYTIEPMVRAGIAYTLFDSLEIAADLDLTSNNVLTDDLESQMVGGGLDFKPFESFFALSLRAGLMQNLHDNDKAGLVYTTGIGIGLKWLQIDLSGQMSSNSNTTEDVTVPQYAKINLALISRW